jgi:hypothetical protein
LKAGLWYARAEGAVQSGVFPVDLRSDLALHNRWQFLGTLVYKPTPRNRIIVEGGPFRFAGSNLLSRTISYGGRTYLFEETVSSEAELTYFYAGYQRDLVARERGHFGVRGGGAYLDASGRISSESTSVSAARSYRIGVPLAGVDGRVYLAPRRLDIDGNLSGMKLGGYGHYVQGEISLGVSFGVMTLRAGYRMLNADVHENRPADVSRAGVSPQFTGPMFTIAVRDR